MNRQEIIDKYNESVINLKSNYTEFFDIIFSDMDLEISADAKELAFIKLQDLLDKFICQKRKIIISLKKTMSENNHAESGQIDNNFYDCLITIMERNKKSERSTISRETVCELANEIAKDYVQITSDVIGAFASSKMKNASIALGIIWIPISVLMDISMVLGEDVAPLFIVSNIMILISILMYLDSYKRKDLVGQKTGRQIIDELMTNKEEELTRVRRK